VLFASALIFIQACSNNNPNASPDHQYEVNLWHSKRIDGLKKDTGWLNLVGLYWLEEGQNTFGSSDKNKIVFPKNAPEEIGVLILKDSTVVFNSSNKSDIKLNGETINNIEMKQDISGNPTILEVGSLRWFIIKRGDKYGIRLRDLEAELLKTFEGIDRFPIDSLWKIKAQFQKYDPPKKIMIPTILGTVEESFSPGKLTFSIDNKEFSLEPTSAGQGLFVVFADLTSGEETYGAGRFLYIDGPDTNNNVVLDFNKAYNPPCAFTKYATCPLPPEGNKLKIRVTAGEKNYGHGH
jgi:uncharacterized protein (DUF1684 family)